MTIISESAQINCSVTLEDATHLKTNEYKVTYSSSNSSVLVGVVKIAFTLDVPTFALRKKERVRQMIHIRLCKHSIKNSAAYSNYDIWQVTCRFPF